MKKIFTLCLAILLSLTCALAVTNFDVSLQDINLEEGASGTGVLKITNLDTNNLTITTAAFVPPADIATRFKDNDGDTITLTSFPDLVGLNLTPAGTTGSSATFNIQAVPSSTNIDEGEYSASYRLTINEVLTKTFSVNLFVTPEICEDGKQGDDLSVNIDGLKDSGNDEDEEFYPGDNMEVEITVESNDAVDDVVVEAMLYDLTNGEELTDWIEWDEGKFDLDDEDSNDDIVIELGVPRDVEEDDNIVILARVYEDDNEDENCIYTKEDSDFKIVRDKHDMYIEVQNILPTEQVDCSNDEFQVEVYVENMGSADEEDVYIQVKDSTGKLKAQTVDKFDIDSLDDAIKLITVVLPDNLEAKDYSLEATVYFDDGDKTESAFKTITVTCAKANNAPVAEAGPAKTVSKGTAVTLDASGSSDADNDALTYTWTQVSGLQVQIQNPTSKTATVTLDNADTYIFKVTVDDGKIQTADTVTITVGSGSGSITGNTVFEQTSILDKLFKKETLVTIFWVLGVLVLLLLAIYFIKLIMFPRSGAREF